MPPIKTMIYLDVLLLTNFALTLLFLLAAGLLAGVECRAGRLLLGGAYLSHKPRARITSA